MATGAHRRAHGAEFAARRFGCVSAVFGESLPAWTVAVSALCCLAVLVYHASRKAIARIVVEKAAARPLRPDAGTRIRRQGCRASVACGGLLSGMKRAS